MNLTDTLPNSFFTFRVIDTPSAGYRVKSVTVNGNALTLPANGKAANSVFDGVTYTVAVDANGKATVTGQSLKTNDVRFEHEAIPGGGGGGGGTGGGGGGGIVYTLYFAANGGSDVADVKASAGSVIGVSSYSSSREGYTFEGWYSDSALTSRVTSVTMDSDKTVYAKWTPTEKPEMFRKDHIAYVIGYNDGTVRPNASIARSEVAAIFFRLLDDDTRESNMTTVNNFSDVAGDAWYNTAVSTLASMGIINGRGNGVFDGEATITRAEFAAIAARFDSGAYSGADKFSDVGGHWAAELINRAAAKGWILGYSDGSFKPDQSITRAEAMTLINRVLGRLPETKADLLADMVTWPDNGDESAWYYLAVQEATNSHDHSIKADGTHETWTKLNPTPDWLKYEK